MRKHIWTVLAFAVILMHCGGNYIGEDTGGSLYLIVEEEIRNINASNAYDAISMLRPALLNYDERRTANSSNVMPAKVYLDGARYGSKSSLRNINIEQVEQIEYLRPQEATLRYGSDHGGGAFMITTR